MPRVPLTSIGILSLLFALMAATGCARAPVTSPVAHGKSVAAPPAITVVSSRDQKVPDVAKQEGAPAAKVGAGTPAHSHAEETEVLAGTAGDVIPAEVRIGQQGIERTRLVRAAAKYPLHRVEEVLTRDKGVLVVSSVHTMVADHLMVSVPVGTTAAALAKAAGCTVRWTIPGSRLALLSFDYAKHQDYLDARRRITAVPGVNEAESDWIVHAIGTLDDTDFAKLWGMDNTGQTGGTPDADIDAPEAWAISTGSASVLVGVIDTGIDASHPDLAGNMWLNVGETGIDPNGNPRQSNSLDDDGNGYIDDFRGWDFVNNDNDPHDDHFHGTHCAGTIGAVGGNGQGVAGVCWDVSLVGLKFLSASGGGTTSDAIAAVLYGNIIGCDLTSNSWGGGGFSQELKNAIDAAGAQGRLFVAAAGNNGTDNDTNANYPSNYDSPNIIAVAATDHNDSLAVFSCFGASTVDIGAPGVNVYSCQPGGLYQLLSGTSMATPHVAGACALIKSVTPSLSGAQIKQAVLATAQTIPALAGKCVTSGRLNLHDALVSVAGPQLSLSAVNLTEQGDGDGIIEPGEGALVTCTIANVGNEPAESAMAELVTADSMAWITGGNHPLGTLAPGASATVAWTMSVSSVSAPHTIACTLAATATTNGPWNFPVGVPVRVRSLLSGTVTRVGGITLSGAQISVDGGVATAQSGADGSYSLNLLDGAHQIACSYPGLITQTVQRQTPGDIVVNFQLGSPDIAVTPASLAMTVPGPASGFTIVNTGDQPLIWQATMHGSLLEFSSAVMTGLWHADDYRLVSAPAAWYYGRTDTRNYDTGAANSGSMTFPAVTVGVGQGLLFSSWRQAESGPFWDVTT